MRTMLSIFGGLWLAASIVATILFFPLGIAMLVIWFMGVLVVGRATV